MALVSIYVCISLALHMISATTTRSNKKKNVRNVANENKIYKFHSWNFAALADVDADADADADIYVDSELHFTNTLSHPHTHSSMCRLKAAPCSLQAPSRSSAPLFSPLWPFSIFFFSCSCEGAGACLRVALALLWHLCLCCCSWFSRFRIPYNCGGYWVFLNSKKGFTLKHKNKNMFFSQKMFNSAKFKS